MMTTAMLPPHQRSEEVSSADLAALMRGRQFGKRYENDCQSSMNPEIPAYDEAEMAELQEFCRQRGIIGVNFNGMSPRAALKMLKGKMGMTEQTTKRGLING
jgi:hypothetical protein